MRSRPILGVVLLLAVLAAAPQPVHAWSGADTDGDGVPDGLDCAAGYDQAWEVPGEAADLSLALGAGAETILTWTDPPTAGAWTLYDTLRSPAPGDFGGPAICVESDDGSDTVAVDTDVPAAGELFCYLVRAENFCASGTLGDPSPTGERSGRPCASPFVCADGMDPVTVGHVDAGDAPRLDEASGLAQSRRNPDVLWSHNDDKEDERIFAIKRDGTVLATYDLDMNPFLAVDPEDNAVGPGPVEGESYVYLGDIGSNDGIWGCFDENSDQGGCSGCDLNAGENCVERDLVVARTVEPVVDPQQSPPLEELNYPASVMTFAFPSTMLGRRQNVETMLLDPVTKDLYFVTKSLATPRVFRAAYPQSEVSVNSLDYVADIDDLSTPTGGDISSDGELIAIRTATEIRIWSRPQTGDLWDAFASPYCSVPAAAEPKGESVALDASNAGSFYTLSERGSGPRHVPIYFFRF
ncbi:MAG: hypothetical protein GY716_07890 [bacterium]|nr:hypothetical protein [bacterium]